VFTGHEGEGKTTSNLDFDQIARTSGTKVILMGVTHIHELTQALLTRGVSADTPVALVQSGTLGRQKSVDGTLATIEKIAAQEQIVPPAVTIIGDVVKLRSKLNWFEHRLLFGQRIVVTRSRAQAPELTKRLAELGADVIEIPAIKIGPPSQFDDLKDALLELNSYEWLVFTSPNGVNAFFDLFFKVHQDTRDIGGTRIAAVGPGTAARLKDLHLQVDLMPKEAIGSRIAAAFARYQSIDNVKICLLRAEKANPDLPEELTKLGAIVDDIPCYGTAAETEDPAGNGRKLMEEGADWLTFTSGSTVKHFHARFDLTALSKKFPKMRIASIGPETSKVLTALGIEPSVEAKDHTMDGLVAALVKVGKR
jgi:uroporphyrinogen III methyltransferase/synthase